MSIITLLIALILLPAWLGQARAVPNYIRNAPRASAYPGWSSLYLLKRLTHTLHPDGRTERRHTVVMKHFTYASSDAYGDPHIAFNKRLQKLKILHSRTYMVDGKQVDTKKNGFNERTPFQLEKAPRYTDNREMVVSFMGWEKGCVTELDYTIADQAKLYGHLWGDYFLRTFEPALKVELILRVPQGTKLFHACPNCAQKPKKGRDGIFDTYTWRVRRQKGSDYEDNKGKRRIFWPHVIYSTAASWKRIFVKLKERVYGAVDSSPLLKSLVMKLVKGRHTKAQLARAMNRYVSKFVNTIKWPLAEFDYRPRKASAVLDSGYGHQLDKAVLLLALLKAANIEARALFASRSLSFAEKVPSPLQFGKVMVEALLGSGKISFDPSGEAGVDPMASLEGHTLFRLAGGSHKLEQLPQSAAEENRAMLTGKISFDGKLKGSGRLSLSLTGALKQNRRFASVKGAKAFIMKAAGKLFPGAKWKSHHVRGLGPEGTSLSIKIAGPRLKANKAGLIFLPTPGLPGACALKALSLYRNKRRTPVILRTAFQSMTEVEMALPKGFSILYRPADVSLDLVVGTLSIKMFERKGKLHITKSLTLNNRLIPAGVYSQLRRLANEAFSQRNNVVILKEK